MREFPPGFEFHKGLDGLVIGLSIIFLVRLEMVISSVINWRIIPQWSYEPIVLFKSGITSGIVSAISPLFSHVQLSGGSGGVQMVLEAIPESISFVLTVFGAIIGAPVVITGVESTLFLRQLFVVIGFWIAVVPPLWWWVVQPGLFWWRERSDYEFLRGRDG